MAPRSAMPEINVIVYLATKTSDARERRTKETSADFTHLSVFRRRRRMSVHPFAGLNPRPSAWGYNWTADQDVRPTPPPHHPAPMQRAEASSPDCQFAHLPAALLGTMKREKKPFTYTPGGVDLSEVLNARLQKRLERKKKYCEEHTQAAPPRQVVVMPTYNMPIEMYSTENALQALELQAGLRLADDHDDSVPFRSATLPRNHTFRFEDKESVPVAQSKAFKVLQIITDTEEGPDGNVRPQHRDEMRFTGVRDSRSIPSKFFHTLQKITGTDRNDEEEEEQEQHPTVQSTRPVPQMKANVQQSMCFGTTTLKRPAAFLPVPFRANGRIHPPAGTDF